MKNRELTLKKEPSFWSYSLVNRKVSVCFAGVRSAFPGIPEDVKKVTFVFSTRPHPEAVKLSYAVPKNDWDWLSNVGMSIIEDDYVLYMDDEAYYLEHHADMKVRALWEQGYNYMRAEYVV